MFENTNAHNVDGDTVVMEVTLLIPCDLTPEQVPDFMMSLDNEHQDPMAVMTRHFNWDSKVMVPVGLRTVPTVMLLVMGGIMDQLIDDSNVGPQRPIVEM